MALRVFSVPPRKGGRGVSLGHVHDGRYRHTGRSDACQEDGSSNASRGQERREQTASNPTSHREQGGSWSRKTGEQADRGVCRYLFVLVLAVGDETVEDRHEGNSAWNASERKGHGGFDYLVSKPGNSFSASIRANSSPSNSLSPSHKTSNSPSCGPPGLRTLAI